MNDNMRFCKLEKQIIALYKAIGVRGYWCADCQEWYIGEPKAERADKLLCKPCYARRLPGMEMREYVNRWIVRDEDGRGEES